MATLELAGEIREAIKMEYLKKCILIIYPEVSGLRCCSLLHTIIRLHYMLHYMLQEIRRNESLGSDLLVVSFIHN